MLRAKGSIWFLRGLGTDWDTFLLGVVRSPLFSILCYYIILYYIILYYIILYHIILYYIILYFILFCSNLFCSILFYAIIFHHIILYYIILQAFGTSFSFCHKVSNAVHDMVLLAPLHCRTPSLFCFILCVKTTFHATC